MAKRSERTGNALRTAVLVLGMHRGGSSALTRVVNLLGAALPRLPTPPGPSNPRGAWESERLVQLHDELLAALDSSWDDWRPLGAKLKDNETALDLAGRIRLAVDEEYGNAPLFVLKDPRLCRALPFWMTLLERSNIRSAPLIIVRNPLEVAYSLRERDGFPLDKSLLMWLRHSLDAEYETRHLARNIVTYDALLEDWKSLVVQSGARMGVTWPRPPLQASTEIREFLSDELHRHRASRTDLEEHEEVPHWVKGAYSALTRLCDEPKNAEPKHELDKIRYSFGESCKVFGGVAFAQTERVRQLTAETAAAVQRAETADEIASAHRGAHEKCAKELAATATQVMQLKGELAVATARAEEHGRVIHDLETALGQAKSQIKETSAASDEFERRAKDGERKLADLVKEVAQLRQVAKDAAELKATASRLSERFEWIESELRNHHAQGERADRELEEARSNAQSLSTAMQSTLSNSASLTQELTAAKSQIYEYQAAALKAANEARRLQERLAAARKRIANLQSQGRLAKAEAAELTEDLEGPKAKPGVVQRLVNGAAGNTPQATADMLNTIQTDVELERAARDAHALAGRIGSDLRAKPAEKKRHGWLSTALRRMAGMGPPSEPVAKPEPAPPQPKPAERSRGRARATSASVSRVAAKAP